MRRRFGTVGAMLVFEAAVFLAGVPEAAAQKTAASFAWYGELVAADAAARTITARAQVLPHVALYAPSFKPGEKVVLVWEPVKEESDRLLFIAREDAMKGVEVGYIVRAEMVSADAAARTVTFRARMSDTALSGISSVAPGQWIRVTMPRVQSNGAEMLMAIAATEKPNLPPRPAAPSGAVPAAGAPAAPTPGGGGPAAAIAGTWVVKAELAGNELSSECTFAVQGAKLGGILQESSRRVCCDWHRVRHRRDVQLQRRDPGEPGRRRAHGDGLARREDDHRRDGSLRLLGAVRGGPQ